MTVEICQRCGKQKHQKKKHRCSQEDIRRYYHGETWPEYTPPAPLLDRLHQGLKLLSKYANNFPL